MKHFSELDRLEDAGLWPEALSTLRGHLGSGVDFDAESYTAWDVCITASVVWAAECLLPPDYRVSASLDA